MSTTIDRKSLPFLAKVSKKRTAFLRVCDSVSLYGRYWDGGSRNEYSLYREGKLVHRFPSANPPQFGGRDESVDLAPNEVVVQCGISSGKPAFPWVMGPLTALIPLMALPFGAAMRVFYQHSLDDDVIPEVLHDWFVDQENEKGAEACQQFLCTTSERG